jgi:hypothetical protein
MSSILGIWSFDLLITSSAVYGHKLNSAVLLYTGIRLLATLKCNHDYAKKKKKKKNNQ